MADLLRYEQLRLTVEKLLNHPSMPVAANSSFIDAINAVRDAMKGLDEVPMRRLARPMVTPRHVLNQGELSPQELDHSQVILTQRRGVERRGPGYHPEFKRRKTDV